MFAKSVDVCSMSKVCSCVHRWKNLVCCVEQCLFEWLHNKQTVLPLLAYKQSSLCYEQSLLCYFPLKQGLFVVNKLQETFAQVLANKTCIFLELSKVCSWLSKVCWANKLFDNVDRVGGSPRSLAEIWSDSLPFRPRQKWGLSSASCQTYYFTPNFIREIQSGSKLAPIF